MTASIQTVPTRRLDTGLAILRVIIGLVFVAHGCQKLFVFGLSGVTVGFTQMGAPFPAVTAPLISCLEFIGGILLVVGLFTRWVTILLALDMLGAMVLVHLAGGFFLPTGVEFALSLFAACIALSLTGAGAFSIDRAIAARRSSAAD